MPELPEVEHAARLLRRAALGRRVVEVAPGRGAARIFRPAGPRAFAAALAGARLVEVARRGKQLHWRLEGRGGPVGVLAHLGMTGSFRAAPVAAPPPPHGRCRFLLDDGTALDLDDPRLFGRLRLVPGARFDRLPEVAALGPDPIADGLPPARLAAALARTSRPVKVALLDQRVVAGVGNIYAAEALFRARLDPRRPARRLAAAEVARLARAVVAVLAGALRAQAAEPDLVYLSAGGENPFRVYGRAGEPCPRRCGAAVVRFVQAARATFCCPRCQR